MRLQSEQASSYESDKEDPNVYKKEESIDMSGFVESQAGDIPYETMFENFYFSMNFKEIYNNAHCEKMLDIACEVRNKSGSMFQVRTELIPVDLKAYIVANLLYKHRKIDFEAASKGLSVKQVKNTINYTPSDTSKSTRKSFNLMRFKLSVQPVYLSKNSWLII